MIRSRYGSLVKLRALCRRALGLVHVDADDAPLSVRHIGLVLDHLEAPAPVKLVALILADHCDADGFCWPSYRRLAERSCLSERSVRRHVHELIAGGIVTKVRTGCVTTKGGRRLRITNAYRVNADALAGRPSLLSTAEVCIVDSPVHLEVAISGRSRWSGVATKPSLEPSHLTVSAVEDVDNVDAEGPSVASCGNEVAG